MSAPRRLDLREHGGSVVAWTWQARRARTASPAGADSARSAARAAAVVLGVVCTCAVVGAALFATRVLA